MDGERQSQDGAQGERDRRSRKGEHDRRSRRDTTAGAAEKAKLRSPVERGEPSERGSPVERGNSGRQGARWRETASPPRPGWGPSAPRAQRLRRQLWKMCLFSPHLEEQHPVPLKAGGMENKGNPPTFFLSGSSNYLLSTMKGLLIIPASFTGTENQREQWPGNPA